jgi:hypothetical protein
VEAGGRGGGPSAACQLEEIDVRMDARGGPGGGGGPPGLPIIILDILTPGVEGPLVKFPSSLPRSLGEGVRLVSRNVSVGCRC